MAAGALLPTRGAFTARSLAGLIGLCGLLKPPYLGHPLQDDIAKIASSDLSTEAKRTKISTLDIEAHKDVPIECVGVWDTTESKGTP